MKSFPKGKAYLLLSMVLMIYALYLQWKNSAFNIYGAKLIAHVVPLNEALEHDFSEKDGRIGITFTDEHGKISYAVTDTWLSYTVGEQLEVYWISGDPGQVQINSFIEREAYAALLLLTGIVLLFVALLKTEIIISRNGVFQWNLEGNSMPRVLRKIIEKFPGSSWTPKLSRIRLTDPTTGEEREYDSLDQVPLERRAEIESAMQVGMTSQSAETYLFKNPDGSDTVYHSLEEMPPEIRKIFESLHRR